MMTVTRQELDKLINKKIGNNIAFQEDRKQYDYKYILKTGDQSLLLHYTNDIYLGNPSILQLDDDFIKKNFKYQNSNKIWNARIQLCFREIKLYEDYFEISLYNSPETWIQISYYGIEKITLF